MRLWHQDLIKHLPRQQLLGLHRECCALRGKGWGKKHSTVDYVFKYGFVQLYFYHRKVIREMEDRGYKTSYEWMFLNYRGKRLGRSDVFESFNECVTTKILDSYPEHDDDYYNKCLDNLKAKGIDLGLERR